MGRMITRTQIGRECGLTVAALKRHLVAAGLLDPTGRAPSLAAHLQGIAQWRVKADDEFERYFVMDADAVMDALPKNPTPVQDRAPLVHSKHKAGDLLAEAGHLLNETVSAKQRRACSYGTPEIGWLMFEAGLQSLYPVTREDRLAYAARLASRRAAIELLAKRRVIRRNDDYKRAMVIHKAVEAWYAGTRTAPTVPATTAPVFADPPVVSVLPANERVAEATGVDGMITLLRLTDHERALLDSGYTLRSGGPATGPLTEAIHDACLAIVHDRGRSDFGSFTEQAPWFARMDARNEHVLLCGTEPDELKVTWSFRARIDDLGLSIGAEHASDDQHERLGYDVEAGLVPTETALVRNA